MNIGEPVYRPTPDGLYATNVGFRLQLQSLHFGGPVPSTGTSLILRCTAQIGNFYQEYTEVELGIPQRDPIPARVTSSGVISVTKLTPMKIRLITVSFWLASAFTWLHNYRR